MIYLCFIYVINAPACALEQLQSSPNTSPGDAQMMRNIIDKNCFKQSIKQGSGNSPGLRPRACQIILFPFLLPIVISKELLLQLKRVSLGAWCHGSMPLDRNSMIPGASFSCLFFQPIFDHFSATFHAHFWSQNVPKVLPKSTLIFHRFFHAFFDHFGDFWVSLGTENDNISLCFTMKFEITLFHFVDRHGAKTRPKGYQKGPRKHTKTSPKHASKIIQKKTEFRTVLGAILAPKMTSKLVKISENCV